MSRVFLSLLLCLCLLLPLAAAEETDPAEVGEIEEIDLDAADPEADEAFDPDGDDGTVPDAAEADPNGASGPAVTTADGAFPPLNGRGFLDEGEFVFEDDEAGVWRYCSPTLRVEIFRRTQAKPKLVWYEAEIFAAEGERFDMLPWSDTKYWTDLNYPYKIARRHRTVFALNSDFAHLRLSKRMTAGILVRNGEIVYSRTNRKNRSFPNYDTLALMPDGGMQVYWSNELTAREYLDLGADDVLAFGPWLIRDGELNRTALNKFGTGSAPRTAVGMAEKGHYFAIMTEGRNSRSRGTSIRFCGERLLEMGCTLAFNLDGGQSSAMVFMGRQICLVTNDAGRRASARKTAEILGIGTSERVAGMDDPF